MQTNSEDCEEVRVEARQDVRHLLLAAAVAGGLGVMLMAALQANNSAIRTEDRLDRMEAKIDRWDQDVKPKDVRDKVDELEAKIDLLLESRP